MAGIPTRGPGFTALPVAFPQDRRYNDLTEEQLPLCESLKDTIALALPFWNDEGKRVLIATHVKHLEGESPQITPCVSFKPLFTQYPREVCTPGQVEEQRNDSVSVSNFLYFSHGYLNS